MGVLVASGNARRGALLWLADHCAMRRRQAGRHGASPRMPLPRGARYGDARLDARQGLSAVAIGESLAVPEMRITGCSASDHNPTRDADGASGKEIGASYRLGA